MQNQSVRNFMSRLKDILHVYIYHHVYHEKAIQLVKYPFKKI